ncbi:MAG TPA: DUF1415 domain-containing protein [Stenotrophobium sp.]|jgi:hypothetical protein|nr:DUF1415 domain-containing protein [Stenotrophobium sp.]
MPSPDAADVEAEVRRWLERVVIGLNLCPFAAKPASAGTISIAVTEARDEETLLTELHAQLMRLDDRDAGELETILLVIPRMLQVFDRFNQFLDLADALLDEFGWAGTYQIASFHPRYRFDGTEPDARENLTNRAPYPILHLLREASLDEALASYPNPEAIPARNIRHMERLDAEQVRELFPYLDSGYKTAV